MSNVEDEERVGLHPSTGRHHGVNIQNDAIDIQTVYDMIAVTVVDTKMKVNDTLVDNVFRQTEFPVAVCIPADGFFSGIRDLRQGRTEKWLYSTAGIGCNVRWLAAFITQIGDRWTHECRLAIDDPFANQVAEAIQIQALLHVTVPLPMDIDAAKSSELLSFLDPIQPFILPLEDSNYSFQDYVFAYSHGLTPRALRGLKTMSIFVNEALNSMDSSTLDSHMERGVDVVNNASLGSMAALLVLLSEQNQTWGLYRDLVNRKKTQHALSKNSIPMSLLLQQIELADEQDPGKILDGTPIPKKLCSVLLWDKETNRSLLQASVHVDNILALEIESPYGRRRGIFLGCVAETVRSFLAKCYSSANDVQ